MTLGHIPGLRPKLFESSDCAVVVVTTDCHSRSRSQRLEAGAENIYILEIGSRAAGVFECDRSRAHPRSDCSDTVLTLWWSMYQSVLVQDFVFKKIRLN